MQRTLQMIFLFESPLQTEDQKLPLFTSFQPSGYLSILFSCFHLEEYLYLTGGNKIPVSREQMVFKMNDVASLVMLHSRILRISNVSKQNGAHRLAHMKSSN